MQGFDPSSYGEGFADVYDDWYGDVSDVDATVALVAALAEGGPVLELGIGTGRLALPLMATGLEVHGIDASPAMVERLRAKPSGDTIPVTLGDFADVEARVPGGFAVVLAAYNTWFNLASAEAQVRCMANVARRLRPGGALVLEAFVPGPEPDGPTGAVTPSAVDAGQVVLQVTQRDPITQTVDGSIVSITETGIRLRPWHIRYTRPDQLDDMAAAAGLTLAQRHADWRAEPFVDDSSHHVSVYRRPATDGADPGPSLGGHGAE